MRALDSRLEERWRVVLALVVGVLSIGLMLLIDFDSTVGAEKDDVSLLNPTPTVAPDTVIAPTTTPAPTTSSPVDTTQAPESEVVEVQVEPSPTSAPTQPPQTSAPTTAPPTTTPPTTTPPTTGPPDTTPKLADIDSPPNTDAPPATEPPPTTEPPTTEPPTTEPPTTEPPGEPGPVTPVPAEDGDPTADQWWALRQCESTNNYQAVSSSGRFRGAYQFSQATWDWVAERFHPTLSGQDPAAAMPANQDAMALALTRMQSPSNAWPVCSFKAGIA